MSYAFNEHWPQPAHLSSEDAGDPFTSWSTGLPNQQSQPFGEIVRRRLYINGTDIILIVSQPVNIDSGHMHLTTGLARPVPTFPSSMDNFFGGLDFGEVCIFVLISHCRK